MRHSPRISTAPPAYISAAASSTGRSLRAAKPAEEEPSGGRERIERISPHPVLLPMGEGTPEQGRASATPFPLPWGEGQGEGRVPRSLRHAAQLGDSASCHLLDGG